MTQSATPLYSKTTTSTMVIKSISLFLFVFERAGVMLGDIFYTGIEKCTRTRLRMAELYLKASSF